MAMAASLVRLLRVRSFPRQRRAGSAMEFGPYSRTELTGPWADSTLFGRRLITPEGCELAPEDLARLSPIAYRLLGAGMAQDDGPATPG